MNTFKNKPLPLVIVVIADFTLTSCDTNSANKNTPKKEIAVAPRWVDPRKGKIWSKENIVQIPLTAMENHILGPIKSVSYKDYKIKDGATVLDDSGYNVYDKQGHLIDQNEYDAKGTLKWHCIYSYNDKGAPLSWDFTFDRQPKKQVTIFKCDDKGNKISDSTYEDGTYASNSVYQYDGKGNELRKVEYKKNHVHNSIDSIVETYTYDSRGFQTEWHFVSVNGKMDSRILKNYDNEGNDTSAIDYRNTVWGGTERSLFDNKGRRTQSAYFDTTGKMREKTSYKYDDWDNVIELLSYKPDGSIDTSRWNTFADFVYDAHGNATKETSYKLKNGQKVMTDVAECKFEYY